MSDPDGTSFGVANSVAYVTTTEDRTKFELPPFFDGFNTNLSFVADNKNIKLDWVLVDVDGDGDFSAGTDMAIALAGTHNGALTPVDFVCPGGSPPFAKTPGCGGGFLKAMSFRAGSREYFCYAPCLTIRGFGSDFACDTARRNSS